MAKRITELTSATVLAETDLLLVVDTSDTTQATSGTTKKSALSLIADYIKARVETLTNKTLTSPKINEDVELTATSTELNKTEDIAGDIVGTTDTQTLTNKTIDVGDNTLSGLLDWFYPIGTIYETTSSDLDTTTKMNNHFGGTWEAYGSGRVLVAKSTDTEFDTIGKTGGEKTHTLTEAQIPSHSHKNLNAHWTSMNLALGGGGWGFSADSAGSPQMLKDIGGGESHNNLQPYIVVYRYRRTA